MRIEWIESQQQKTSADWVQKQSSIVVDYISGLFSVYFPVTYPPQIHPCCYGIDIATDRELIASTARIEEIAEYIKADALIYQETNILENAIGLKDRCHACLDGEYPTEYAQTIRDKDQKLGITPTGRNYERNLSE
jgi:glutamine phosphoribosylpyrophosphate amidotransferase